MPVGGPQKAYVFSCLAMSVVVNLASSEAGCVAMAGEVNDAALRWLELIGKKSTRRTRDRSPERAPVPCRDQRRDDGEALLADVDGGDGGKVKACVEGAIGATRFPTIDTPLATAERTWTVAAQ